MFIWISGTSKILVKKSEWLKKYFVYFSPSAFRGRFHPGSVLFFLVCSVFLTFLFCTVWLCSKPKMYLQYLMYILTYIPGLYFACQVPLQLLLLCVAVLLLLRRQKLGSAAVRHCVPCGNVCCWQFIELKTSVPFIFIQIRLIVVYPLAVVPLLQPRFTYSTSSVPTGMPGAEVGVMPQQRSRQRYNMRPIPFDTTHCMHRGDLH